MNFKKQLPYLFPFCLSLSLPSPKLSLDRCMSLFSVTITKYPKLGWEKVYLGPPFWKLRSPTSCWPTASIHGRRQKGKQPLVKTAGTVLLCNKLSLQLLIQPKMNSLPQEACLTFVMVDPAHLLKLIPPSTPLN